MSRHSRIHGSLTLSHSPTSEQLESINEILVRYGLDNMLTFEQKSENREMFTCDWRGESETTPTGKYVFAKRLASVIESPHLDAFNPTGEFIILSDEKPIPSIERLSVKAGIVTHTAGRHTWEPVSTIVRPVA